MKNSGFVVVLFLCCLEISLSRSQETAIIPTVRTTRSKETAIIPTVRTSSCTFIHWYVKTSPAVLHGTVELICKVDGQFNKRTTRKWERDGLVLTSKGTSTNASKFEEKWTDNGFALRIMHFQVSDLNKDYTCVYGFKRCHHNLTTNVANFEVHPANETFTTKWNVAAGNLEVQIMFALIYPIPQCKVIYNEKYVAQSIETRSHHVGLLYSTNVTVEESIGSVYIKQLKITCTVGSKDFVVIDFSNHTKIYKNVGKRQVEHEKLHVLITLMFGIYNWF